MPKFRVRFVAALAILAMVGVACGDEPTSTPQPAEQDLLSRVEDRGVLEIATDSKYKPQSWFVVRDRRVEGLRRRRRERGHGATRRAARRGDPAGDRAP